MIGQERDVLAALAKRRHAHAHHRHPIIEIGAELSLPHQRLEISIRRGHHADVDRARLDRSDRDSAPRLEHAEQLGLERWRELAELVEEHGPAARRLECADPILVGTGEGALPMAEELALQQALDHRAAVDHDERAGRTARPCVNRLREQLFAGAGLALDQDGRRGSRGPLELDQHAADLVGGGQELSEAADLLGLACPRLGGDTDRGSAEANGLSRPEHARVDPRRANPRPVPAVEIHHHHAVEEQVELCMAPRDAVVGELEIGAGPRTHAQGPEVAHDRPRDVRALDDLDPPGQRLDLLDAREGYGRGRDRLVVTLHGPPETSHCPARLSLLRSPLGRGRSVPRACGLASALLKLSE